MKLNDIMKHDVGSLVVERSKNNKTCLASTQLCILSQWLQYDNWEFRRLNTSAGYGSVLSIDEVNQAIENGEVIVGAVPEWNNTLYYFAARNTSKWTNPVSWTKLCNAAMKDQKRAYYGYFSTKEEQEVFLKDLNENLKLE